MSGIPPLVRHLLLCREVRKNANDPLAVDIIGLISGLRSGNEPPFPFRAPPFGAFLQLAGGRGSGTCHVRIRYTDTGTSIYDAGYDINFSPNPLTIRNRFFLIADAVFPRPGLYMVQFGFDKA